MTHTANHLIPAQGKFRRAMAAIWAFLQALESGPSGYTFDRIEGLEREVRRLKQETASISVRRSESVSRRNPPTMWDMASLGYSHISIAEPGRLAFLSGQIAVTPGGQGMPDDLAGQAKLSTASLAAALKDLEATAQDIVMLRVYVVNATTELFGQALTPYT